jgi:hypothetical protein
MLFIPRTKTLHVTVVWKKSAHQSCLTRTHLIATTADGGGASAMGACGDVQETTLNTIIRMKTVSFLTYLPTQIHTLSVLDVVRA